MCAFPGIAGRTGNRLGVNLRNTAIKDGVAQVQIQFAESLTRADIGTLKTYLQNQGANSAVVNTGFVINPRLAESLDYLAGKGGSLFGGKVRTIDSEFKIFELTFDLLP